MLPLGPADDASQFLDRHEVYLKCNQGSEAQYNLIWLTVLSLTEVLDKSIIDIPQGSEDTKSYSDGLKSEPATRLLISYNPARPELRRSVKLEGMIRQSTITPIYTDQLDQHRLFVVLKEP